MIKDLVIEIDYVAENLNKVINNVETSIALLKYVKPKPRSIVVPGEYNELPEEIAGGLVKRGVTPEGVLYTTDDGGPGFQIESGIYTDPEVSVLFDSIFNLVKTKHIEFTEEKNLPYYQHSWFFVSPPSNTESVFHNHLYFNNTFPHDVPSYTWVYYVQLPDNCKDDEGKLIFRESDDTSYILDVKPNTIYLFPSYLDHKPNLAPNSTLNRITAAGNILIPGSEKSLFSE